MASDKNTAMPDASEPLSLDARVRALELAFIAETIARANPRSEADVRALMADRAAFWTGIADALGEDDSNGLSDGVRRLAGIIAALGQSTSS